MVFLSFINFYRVKGAHRFWRKRKIFKITAAHYGRKRNCYSIAVRSFQKSLLKSSKSRLMKADQRKALWITRVDAACQEHGTNHKVFMEGLARCNVALNYKCLVDISIYEPRTFKCLIDLSKAKDFFENPKGLNSLEFPPEGVITRGMI